jgi:hypothetical protein
VSAPTTIIEHVFDQRAMAQREGGLRAPLDAPERVDEPGSLPDLADRGRTSVTGERSFALGEAGAEGPTPPGSRPTWDDLHPLAALLGRTPAGSDFVRLVAAQEPADVDDAALVELVAAWERVASWAAAHQSAVIAEMLRRADGGRSREFVADEVAAVLAVSPRAGQSRVEVADALDRLPALHDALATGAADQRKVAALLRETDHLPESAAARVIDAVLPAVSDRTVPQLRGDVRRAELLIDPSAAETRHRAARRSRCVRMRPAPDAMAWIEALLPAPDATAVMEALDAVAAAASPEDVRSVDERRADALSDLARGLLDRGSAVDGTPLPSRRHRHPHLSVTIAATTLAGQDDLPAILGGYGLVPAAVARDLLSDAPRRVVLTDPVTGEMRARSARTYRPPRHLAGTIAERDVTCTFPGCRVPAERCDQDHIEPFDGNVPADRQTTTSNLHTLCRHHHRMKTLGRWAPTRDHTTGVTHWVSPTGHRYTRDPVPAGPVELPPRSGPGWGSGPPGEDHRADPVSRVQTAEHRSPDDSGDAAHPCAGEPPF